MPAGPRDPLFHLLSFLLDEELLLDLLSDFVDVGSQILTFGPLACVLYKRVAPLLFLLTAPFFLFPGLPFLLSLPGTPLVFASRLFDVVGRLVGSLQDAGEHAFEFPLLVFCPLFLAGRTGMLEWKLEVEPSCLVVSVLRLGDRKLFIRNVFLLSGYLLGDPRRNFLPFDQ